MRLISLALVVAASACCDVSTSINIAPSADEHAADIAEAAERLNAVIGEDAYNVTSTSSESRVDGEVVVRGVDSMPGKAGDAQWTVKGVIVRLAPSADVIAAAHELGHAAGLKHASDPNNLMFHRATGWALTEYQIGVMRNPRLPR